MLVQVALFSSQIVQITRFLHTLFKLYLFSTHCSHCFAHCSQGWGGGEFCLIHFAIGLIFQMRFCDKVAWTMAPTFPRNLPFLDHPQVNDMMFEMDVTCGRFGRKEQGLCEDVHRLALPGYQWRRTCKGGSFQCTLCGCTLTLQNAVLSTFKRAGVDDKTTGIVHPFAVCGCGDDVCGCGDGVCVLV